MCIIGDIRPYILFQNNKHRLTMTMSGLVAQCKTQVIASVPSDTEVIKLFPCSTQHEAYPAHKC